MRSWSQLHDNIFLFLEIWFYCSTSKASFSISHYLCRKKYVFIWLGKKLTAEASIFGVCKSMHQKIFLDLRKIGAGFQSSSNPRGASTIVKDQRGHWWLWEWHQVKIEFHWWSLSLHMWMHQKPASLRLHTILPVGFLICIRSSPWKA
jgi:hypothetical protein